MQNHPGIAFVSTGVEQVDADNYHVTGDLTIKGVTRCVRHPDQRRQLSHVPVARPGRFPPSARAGTLISMKGPAVAFSPVRLNHAVLFVADLQRSVRFYTDVFGMDVAAREPRANAAFLRLPRSGNHHDLGLFGVGTGGGPKRRGAIGLYHLAWQLDTIDELVAARQALLDAGAYTGESSHGATKSVYGADPDGNEFEIMWMLPREEWGPYENAAPIDHLDLADEVARWSGVRTAGRIAPHTQ